MKADISPARMSAAGTVRRLQADILAGVLGSLLSISYCLSFAALIFSGQAAEWLSVGIAITFLSAAASAAVFALTSSIPYGIAAPDTSTAALTATLVASIAARVAHDSEGNLLAMILTVVALATVLTGLVLFVLGTVKAGRAIRFVPFPVIGGFLGATGCLMLAGAVKVVTGESFSFAQPAALLNADTLSKLAAAAGLGLVLHLVLTRRANAFLMPLLLIAAVLLFHGVLFASGMSLDGAQQAGWVFPHLEQAKTALPWGNLPDAPQIPWAALPWLAGDIVALVFVTTISLLLNATGLELVTRKEVNLDRELRALGLSNFLTGALGGYAGCLSLSRTSLAFTSGARGRMTGLTAAVLSAGLLFVNPSFLIFVPKFALGGLLFFAGGRLAYRWLWESLRQIPVLDYLALLAIAVIIIKWGFIAGVGLGMVMGFATFALSVSRVKAVRFSFTGAEYRSSLDRSPAESAILARHGGELIGLSLQSYLFFGTTSALHQHVKELLASNPACRFLVFDFRLVNGMDSSAVHSFMQIGDAARHTGARLVIANLSEDIRRMFRNSGVERGTLICEDLDEALELCETFIIKAHRAGKESEDAGPEWLAEALGSNELAERLISACRHLSIDAGKEIARQGEQSDSMHFVSKGRLGIYLELAGGRSLKVRSLGRHTTIGEMGLVTGKPRSATIRAEEPSELHEMSLQVYEAILRDDPELGHALHRFMMSAMSDRLSFANRMVGALQR